MKSIMFIAGEASGDSHAAAVIRQLPAHVKVFGAGGAKMQAAGAELLLDLTQHAVVGLVEVLKNYRKFKRIFDQLVAEAERRRPAAVVLVDFPGFNLRFAAQMKQRGIKVIYFISPQLWAWHASRSKQIARDVDLMLTIFPFEKDWYARREPGLRVEFVGHPMADRAERTSKSEAESARPAQQIRNPKQVLLLPGSRVREVEKIFPILAGVVNALPDFEFVAAAVDERTAAMMRHPRVRVEIGRAQDWMQRAALAITASGTATMECAFHNCPMVVVYKVNWLTYLIGRAVIQVQWLAMPNVIAGRTIVPEFIQHAATPAAIAQSVREVLQNPGVMQRELQSVVSSLGGPGGSARAAALILQALEK